MGPEIKTQKIPDSWFLCEMGQIAVIVGGGTPKTSVKDNFSENGIKWITPADLSNYKDKYISGGKRCLSSKGLKNSSAKLLPKGTVLFSSRAPIGYVAIASNNLATNQGFRSFVCFEGLVPEYIYYYLRYAKPVAESLASGTTFKEISGSSAAKIPVLIPPTNEQHRIVAKLEKLLAKVDKCKARLEKIPTILKRFRQAVLAATCSGELTKDFRSESPTKISVNELFLEIQKEREHWYKNICKDANERGQRSPRDPRKAKKSNKVIINLPIIPNEWDYFRLEDLCFLVTDGTHFTPKYTDTGVPFLSVKNVRPFLIREKDNKFINKSEHRTLIERCKPEKNDILYTKVGATFGYAAKANFDYEFSIFVSLCLIKPVYTHFLPDYAEIVMNSDLVFSQARERVSGIGTPDLHLIEIRDFRIPYPPIEEQIEIIKRVKNLFKLANLLESRFNKAKSYVDNLTQSILAKAFRGELVPQDPNDEPASELVKRIQTERAELETGKPKRRSEPRKPHKTTAPQSPSDATSENPTPSEESQAKPPAAISSPADNTTRPTLDHADQSDIMAAIRQTCRINGPMPPDDLLRQIAQGFFHKRLSTKFKLRLQGDLHAAKLRKIVQTQNGLISLATKKIDDYDSDMLLKVVLAVMPKSQELDETTVLQKTIRYLGFKRLTGNTKETIAAVLRKANRNGLVSWRQGVLCRL